MVGCTGGQRISWNVRSLARRMRMNRSITFRVTFTEKRGLMKQFKDGEATHQQYHEGRGQPVEVAID